MPGTPHGMYHEPGWCCMVRSFPSFLPGYHENTSEYSSPSLQQLHAGNTGSTKNQNKQTLNNGKHQQHRWLNPSTDSSSLYQHTQTHSFTSERCDDVLLLHQTTRRRMLRQRSAVAAFSRPFHSLAVVSAALLGHNWAPGDCCITPGSSRMCTKLN